MPDTVPGLKVDQDLVELISVHAAAAVRASASVWLQALRPASPPSVLSRVPAHGHAAAASMLITTGSFLSHKAALPFWNLNCEVLRQVRDYRSFCRGGRVLVREVGSMKTDVIEHLSQHLLRLRGVLGPSLCVLTQQPGDSSSEMLCQEFDTLAT